MRNWTCTIEENDVLDKKEGIKCLGTIQITLGTNADCRYIVLKGCIWNSKGNYISVSKKQYVTGVNGSVMKVGNGL